MLNTISDAIMQMEKDNETVILKKQMKDVKAEMKRAKK